MVVCVIEFCRTFELNSWDAEIAEYCWNVAKNVIIMRIFSQSAIIRILLFFSISLDLGLHLAIVGVSFYILLT